MRVSVAVSSVSYTGGSGTSVKKEQGKISLSEGMAHIVYTAYFIARSNIRNFSGTYNVGLPACISNVQLGKVITPTHFSACITFHCSTLQLEVVDLTWWQ